MSNIFLLMINITILFLDTTALADFTTQLHKTFSSGKIISLHLLFISLKSDAYVQHLLPL